MRKATGPPHPPACPRVHALSRGLLGRAFWAEVTHHFHEACNRISQFELVVNTVPVLKGRVQILARYARLHHLNEHLLVGYDVRVLQADLERKLEFVRKRVQRRKRPAACHTGWVIQ